MKPARKRDRAPIIQLLEDLQRGATALQGTMAQRLCGPHGAQQQVAFDPPLPQVPCAFQAAPQGAEAHGGLPKSRVGRTAEFRQLRLCFSSRFYREDMGNEGSTWRIQVVTRLL